MTSTPSLAVPVLRPTTRRSRRQCARRDALRLRASVMHALRSFFEREGFLEVDTPTLVPAPGQEAELSPFRVTSGAGESAFLITSPEHHMKRLVASRVGERIYQVCRCYRDEVATCHHRREFTMVEWYRIGADYEQIADDVERLLRHIGLQLNGHEQLCWQNVQFDLGEPWQRITVDQAFSHFAGVDAVCDLTAGSLARRARAGGCLSVAPDDDWETAFYKVLVERVEPTLARWERPVLLTDYPEPLAALSRLRDQGTHRVAERVEAYIGGLELANGFTELTDAREQRRRFRVEREKRRRSGNELLPLDEGFLRVLKEGVPDCAGIALGFDRLVMLFAGSEDIAHVVDFC